MPSPRLAIMVIATFSAALYASMPVYAQSKANDISIDGAWARVLPHENGTASVYFDITNSGDRPDRLIAGSADGAARVTLELLHFNGPKPIKTRIGEIVVGAKSRVRLVPGGYSVTLMDLREPVRVGQTLDVTLQFARSGAIVIHPKVGNQLLGNEAAAPRP